MIQLLKVCKQFHYTVLKRMNYEYVIMYQIVNYHEYHVCSKLPVVLFWQFSNILYRDNYNFLGMPDRISGQINVILTLYSYKNLKNIY